MAILESGNNQPSHRLQQMIQRYEKALNGEQCGFFDEEDLERIVDYYADNQKIDDAENAVNFGLRMHPFSVSLKARLARLLIMQNRQAAAASLLNTLLQLEPDNVDVLLCKADLLLSENKPEEARRIFKKMVLHPTERVDEVCLSIGYIYFDRKCYEEARNFLSYGFSHGGQRNFDLLFQLAICHEQLGDSNEAIRVYNLVLDIDPYSNDAWFNLGQIYFSQAKYDDALEAYDYAAITGKDDYQAYLQKAHCYFQKECYQKALDAYRDYARRANDFSAPISIFMGECFEQMGDLERAYSFFKKASEDDPDNPDGYAGMCICLMDKNQYVDALPLIQKAIRLNAEVGSYWVYLGDVYENLNEWQLALNAYFHAQIYFTDSQEINVSIAEIYVNMGNYEAALSYLLKARDAAQKIEELPMLAAVCYYKLSQFEQAAEYLTLAILKNPGNEKGFFQYCPEARDDERFSNFNHSN